MHKILYWIAGALFIVVLFGAGFYIGNKNIKGDLTILHTRECVCYDSNGRFSTFTALTITGKYKTTKEMEKYIKEYSDECQQACTELLS